MNTSKKTFSPTTIDLPNAKLVFTVTTGRSGTSYLSQLLSIVPGVSSHHEPDPNFADVFRAVQVDPERAHEFWLKEKLPAIASLHAPVYIETSHLFCKGFLEPLLEIGIIPDLILLSRSHRQVALSLYQLGVIPGKSEKGLRYLISPDESRFLPLPEFSKYHDYQLCYWYCLEIEQRRNYYGRLVREKGARAVSICTECLSSVTEFHRLLGELDLPRRWPSIWLRYLRLRNKRVNTKSHMKEHVGVGNLDVESLENAVVEALDEWNRA